MSRTTQAERRRKIQRATWAGCGTAVTVTTQGMREVRNRMFERNRKANSRLKLDYNGNERVRELQRLRSMEDHNPDYDPPKPDLRWHGDTDEVDGIEYTLLVEDDEVFQDVEEQDVALGTITDYPDKRSSWKIDPDVAHNYYKGRRGFYPGDLVEVWWNPMEEIEEIEGHYRKAGASKQVAREKALALEKQAMERRLNYGENGWYYVSVEVQAHILGVLVGSDCVSGVESDFIENGYAEDLIPELAGEAREDAKARLESKAGLRR